MEVGEGIGTSGDLLKELLFGSEGLLGLGLEGSGLLGRVELALLGVLEVFLAEVVVAGGSRGAFLALGTTGLFHALR
jgi:hypothetical protein